MQHSKGPETKGQADYEVLSDFAFWDCLTQKSANTENQDPQTMIKCNSCGSCGGAGCGGCNSCGSCS